MEEKQRQMSEIKFTPKFLEGEVVYLKTDLEQLPYIVVGYFLQNKRVSYSIQHGTDESFFVLDYELTYDKNDALVNEYKYE